MKNFSCIKNNIAIFKIYILSAGIFIYSQICFSQTETIVPGGDWRDTDGNLVAVTEGGFLQVGDTFYLWGMDRSADNYEFVAVNCYSSTDMMNWKFENKILKKTTHSDLDSGVVVERAKILHNETTGQFVMWMHYEGHKAYSMAHVAYATSPSITEEFTFHGHFRPLKEEIDSRDLNVYKDDDGKAYLICSTVNNSQVRLFLLDDTYTKIVKEVYVGYAKDDMECEGHGIINSDGRYFWLMSWCTGWEFNDNHYFYSNSLSGSWNSGGNIAVANTHTYESQVGFALTLRGSKQKTFIFMGDRWSTRNFGKTRLVLLPIVTNGTSLNVPWYDEWNLNAKTGDWSPCAKKFINGTYTITAKHSGLVLGVKSGSNDVVQQKLDGTKNQFWRIENRGASHFKVTNVASGKSFDVSDASQKAGAKLLQWEWKDSYNQKWHIVDCGEGYHRFISVNTLGKALEIQGASKLPDINVITCDFQYGDHQMFRINSANDDFVSGEMYQIVNRSNGNSIAAVSGDNSVTLSTPSNVAQQTWKIDDQYDGYFTIRNIKNDKALSNNNSLDNESLIMETFTGNYSQQWQFVPADDGYYKIVNRKCGKIAALSQEDGKVIQIDDANSTDRHWEFQRVDVVRNYTPSFIPEVKQNTLSEKDIIIYNINGQVINKLPYGVLNQNRKLPMGLYILQINGRNRSTVHLNLK